MLNQLAAALPLLLRLFWILATFAAVMALIPLPFATGFRNAVLLTACRGKLMDAKPPGALGPLSDLTVPQRWFYHFYAVGSLWNAAVAAIFIGSPAFSSLETASQAAYVVTAALVEVHLVRRLLETIVLLRYPPAARMHAIAYAFSLAYYLVVSLSILPDMAFVSMTGEVEKRGLWGAGAAGAARLRTAPPSLAALPATCWVGAALFVSGNALQLHSHALLARLGSGGGGRRTSRSTAASPQYRIPRGGAFELVSCPHYAAEIVIYLGLALLAGGLAPGPPLMLAWVVANLVLAARLTHAWYVSHFKTYPKRRKAIIPYVY